MFYVYGFEDYVEGLEGIRKICRRIGVRGRMYFGFSMGCKDNRGKKEKVRGGDELVGLWDGEEIFGFLIGVRRGFVKCLWFLVLNLG